MKINRKKDRYEYFALLRGPYNDPEPGAASRWSSDKVCSAFGNLGSQGWRYVETIGDYYIFERKSRW